MLYEAIVFTVKWHEDIIIQMSTGATKNQHTHLEIKNKYTHSHCERLMKPKANKPIMIGNV